MLEEVGADWRGKLIFEESADSVKQRKRMIYQMMGITEGTLAIMIVLGVFIPALDAQTSLDSVSLLFWVICMVMTLVFYYFLLRSIKPYRFFENAMEYSIGSGQGFPLAYSEIEKIEAPRWYRQGYYLLVLKKRTLGIHGKLPLPSTIFASHENIEYINFRIANPNAVHPVWPSPTPESRHRLRMFEFALYPLTYVFTFGLMVAMVSYESPPGAELAIVGLALPFIAIITPFFLLLACLFLLSLAKHSVNYRSESLSIVGISVILIFCMITAPVGIMAFSDIDAPTLDPDLGVPPTTSALISGNYSDVYLYPHGDIFVDSSLSLRNVTLTMEDDAQLWIAESSELWIQDSILRSNGTFKFRVLGTLELNNSTVSNLWGYVDWPTQGGGIEVYGGNLILTNSTITGSASRALIVSGASAKITNCTITDSMYEGIVLLNSSSVIQGNTITGTETGILVKNSIDVFIANNTITENNFGVSLLNSEATIVNNFIANNTDNGIDYDTASIPNVLNNTYQNNFMDISELDDFPMVTCLVLAIVENIVILGIILRNNKKLKTW